MRRSRFLFTRRNPEAVAVTANAEFPARAVLHRATQDRIKRFIIEHGYRPGDLLPGEGELARRLGISRPSLREAMRALQTVGVVETRHGSGTFVGHFSMEALVGGLAFSIIVGSGQNMRTVRELVEIREILERELVGQVARIATPEQIARLHGLVGRMEAKAARGEPFDQEDRAFHDALYLPLGNVLVVQLLRAFWDVFRAVRDELAGLPPMLVETAANHRRIVQTLAAGDTAAVADGMTAHFEGIRQRIGLWEASTRQLAAEVDPASRDRAGLGSAPQSAEDLELAGKEGQERHALGIESPEY